RAPAAIVVEAVEIARGPVGIVLDIGPEVSAFADQREQLLADRGGRGFDAGYPIEFVALEKLPLGEIRVIKDRGLLRKNLALAFEHFERVAEPELFARIRRAHRAKRPVERLLKLARALLDERLRAVQVGDDLR